MFSNISKTYERLMFKQTSEYLNRFYQNFSVVLDDGLVLNNVYKP